jgi:EmrB/QacA subfamily drug resistance transporter
MIDDVVSIDSKSLTGAKLTRRQLLPILGGLQLCLLLAALDQTVVTTAIPRIVAQLNGFERYSWVTSIYLLMSTAATLIFGRLSDLYGRKKVLIGAVLAFVFSSWMCGCAGQLPLPFDGMNQLIIARALQGLAGGAVMTLTFTLVADLFSPAERGKYQGWFAAVFALAAIAGPSLGGLLAEQGNWRWVFFANVPIGLAAALVLYLTVPKSQLSAASKEIDYWGVAALLGFLFPFMLAVDLVAIQGWLSSEVGILLLVAVLALVSLVAWERKAACPILPPVLFKMPMVLLSVFSVFVTGIGMFGSILLIPLFMQAAVGITAAYSGVLLTPLMVAVAIFSIISGQIVAVTGRYKILILSGLLLMSVGTYFLSGMETHTPIGRIMIFMLLTGAGLGILLPLYTIVLQAMVPESLLGIGTALSPFFRSIGGALGTAVFGSIMIGSYQTHLKAHLPSAVIETGWLSLCNPLEAALMPGKLVSSLPSGNTHHFAETIFHQCQSSLVYAIDTVFYMYALILVVTLLLNLALEEIPLQQNKSP